MSNPQPSSVPILKRSLLYGFLYAAAIAVVGGGIAWLTVGPLGALSVVIGAVMAAVFLGITAASILVAIKYDIVAFLPLFWGRGCSSLYFSWDSPLCFAISHSSTSHRSSWP